MKHLWLILALLPAPAFAEGDVDQRLDLLHRGSKLLMQRLMAEIEPNLQALAEEMGPALRDLQGMVGDMTQYHAPEILPNGDIIVRRKVPLMPVVPQRDIAL